MNSIELHLEQIEEAMTLLDQDNVMKIVRVMQAVKKMNGTVYIFGNGGSGATASHFANDLMKICRTRAMCIGDMTPAVSAWSNDTGAENAFYGPLSELVGQYDALVGISCGGNSPNVIQALRAGREEWNVLCVGLTGPTNSLLTALDLDAVVRAMADDIRVQEDIHLMVCHAVVRQIQAET
jgi:D-sedoheptulose 7-phosphate isomerase